MNDDLQKIKIYLRELQSEQQKLEKNQWKLQKALLCLRRSFEGLKNTRNKFQGKIKKKTEQKKKINNPGYRNKRQKNKQKPKVWKTKESVKRKTLLKAGEREICPKNHNGPKCIRPKRKSFELAQETAKDRDKLTVNDKNQSKEKKMRLTKLVHPKKGQIVRIVDDEILHRYLEDALRFHKRRVKKSNYKSDTDISSGGYVRPNCNELVFKKERVPLACVKKLRSRLKNRSLQEASRN